MKRRQLVAAHPAPSAVRAAALSAVRVDGELASSRGLSRSICASTASTISTGEEACARGSPRPAWCRITASSPSMEASLSRRFPSRATARGQGLPATPSQRRRDRMSLCDGHAPAAPWRLPPTEKERPITPPRRPSDVTRLTRRELLKAGGLALGARSVARPALGADAEAGRHARLGPDQRGDRPRSPARARRSRGAGARR